MTASRPVAVLRVAMALCLAIAAALGAWAPAVGQPLVSLPEPPAPSSGDGADAPTALPPVPGQEAPGFRDAVEDWLLDDEARALPALSQLARAGNTAAQMLLAIIDKSPALQGPWLSAQPREARVALMRAPGGMSGTSWMRVAAAVDPRAAAWVALWEVEAPVQVVIDFARLGEVRAAREALVTLTARDRTGFAAIAEDPHYPMAFRLPVWREWQADPDLAGRRAAEIAARPPGDPQLEGVGQPPSPAERAAWLAEAPEAAGLRALCATACPGAEPACIATAHDGFLSLGSFLSFGAPVESLVSAGEFAASPRGQSALLRHLLLTVDMRNRRAMIEAVRGRSGCLAQRLDMEATRYRPAARD